MLAELGELRAIFKDCLPIGDKTEAMEEYFNGLQEVIYTNDFQANPNPLRRESFEHDDPDTQYTYLSDVVFKERSSHPKLRADGQGMGDQPDQHEGQVPQLGDPISADHASLPECQDGHDTKHGDTDSDDPSW